VTRGFPNASEHSRLVFVGVAEKALMRGTRNPCGLFRRLVERKLRHHITQDDEDSAHRRLKEHLYGKPERTTEASETGLAPWSGKIGAIHGGRGRPRLSRVGHLGTMAA